MVAPRRPSEALARSAPPRGVGSPIAHILVDAAPPRRPSTVFAALPHADVDPLGYEDDDVEETAAEGWSRPPAPQARPIDTASPATAAPVEWTAEDHALDLLLRLDGHERDSAEARRAERLIAPAMRAVFRLDQELEGRGLPPLTDGQAAALAVFAVDVGESTMLSSAVAGRLRSGDVDGAADAMLRWARYRDADGRLAVDPAQRRRREAQRELFLGGSPAGSEGVAGYADVTDGARPLWRSTTIWASAANGAAQIGVLLASIGQLAPWLQAPVLWGCTGVGVATIGYIALERRRRRLRGEPA